MEQMLNVEEEVLCSGAGAARARRDSDEVQTKLCCLKVYLLEDTSDPESCCGDVGRDVVLFHRVQRHQPNDLQQFLFCRSPNQMDLPFLLLNEELKTLEEPLCFPLWVSQVQRQAGCISPCEMNMKTTR